MWKILGLVALCGLLGPSEGKPYGNWACTSGSKFGEVLIRDMDRDQFLLSQFKDLSISDVSFAGVLGLVDIITGLKITNVRIDNFVHQFLPAIVGGEMTFACFLDITGHLILDLSALVKITTKLIIKLQYRFENYVSYSFDIALYKCDATFDAFEVTMLSLTLSPSILNTLQTAIVGDINPHVSAIFKAALNKAKSYILPTLNAHYPLGSYGTMHTNVAALPTVFPDSIAVPLYNDLRQGSGNVVSIPDSAGTINVPPLDLYTHQVSCHRGIIDIMLNELTPKDPVEVRCTPDEFTGADGLKTAFMHLVSPVVGAIIGVGTLYAKLSHAENPRIGFVPSPTISVVTKIEFYVKNLDGSFTAILFVKASITLNFGQTCPNGFVLIDTSFARASLTLITSGIGITDIYTLEPHCSNLVREKYFPALKECYSTPIPLPSAYEIIIKNPTFMAYETHPVACI